MRNIRPCSRQGTVIGGGRDDGFSILEILLVVGLIGVLSTILVPQLIRGYERARQQSTLADMRAIAGAAGSYHVDNGTYPMSFSDLEPDYMNPVPSADAWGNAWTFAGDGTTYTLTSLGSDGATGPAAPADWPDEPFEVDLIVTDGAFTQAPQAR